MSEQFQLLANADINPTQYIDISIMELSSNMPYFLTHWTYIANATNGILSGIMPPTNCFQVNGTVTPEKGIHPKLVILYIH